MKYGSPESVKFTEDVAREMAVAGWESGLELAREKGPAPIMNEEFVVTKEMLRKRPEMERDGWKAGAKIPGRLLHARYSRYLQRVAEVAPQLVEQLAQVGARFTHHTSIAPTGTISLSLANNASNGIEPSFAHHYFRNVIRAGRKTKEKIDVFGRADVVGGTEILGQFRLGLVGERHRLGVHQRAVGKQFVAEDLDLFLGFAPLADDVAAVLMGKRRLDAVAGVVGQRQ